MTPKLRALLQQAIDNPGQTVEVTGEAEKELVAIVALHDKHPEIKLDIGEEN